LDLIIAVMQIVGSVEFNLGQQMEEKLMDFMVEQNKR
jgi:hypothetical protein